MSEMEVTQINVPYPEASGLHLRFGVGACRLKVAPGEGEEWVSGTYAGPAGTLPAKVEAEGGTVRITQQYRMAGIGGLFREPPRFDLALGKGQPYALSVDGGAVESDMDLGGLPITRLAIKQGAGRLSFDFSAPNPQPMSLLDLDAGAVSLEMRNLANANFAEMRVDGGAAAYKFDFGGTLAQNSHVAITAGMSSVEVSVPSTTAAKIVTESVVAGLSVGDGYTKQEGAFWTQAAVQGETPELIINVTVSLGSLTILTS